MNILQKWAIVEVGKAKCQNRCGFIAMQVYKNLNLETIDDLRKFLKNFFKGENVEIYLFGSRARGDNTPFSDVDIGILANYDISDKISLLKEILEESTFPYKVDLVDLSSNRELLKVVLREGKRWI